MPFDLQDLIAKLHGSTDQTKVREIMREEAASLTRITPEDVKKLFPNVEMGSSKHLVYVPLKMCHSMPKRNGRGRAFTPKTLSNSFASARDASVNLDHETKRMGGKTDRYIGHIVASRFDPDGYYLSSEAASLPDKKVWIPAQPIPMLALAALNMRAEHVASMIEEHLSGKRKWHTSMECGHDMEAASFHYRGEFIPVKDAEAGMRECVEKFSVRPFKGHELTLCLGGVDGRVDFFGMAMTPQPADGDSKVMAFMTSDVFAEAANQTGKPFFFPIESKEFGNHETKSKIPLVPVDTDGAFRDSELANISILGTTDEADGHTHDILSDGTVVPTNGHTHYIASWSVERGTVPYFTGRTDLHADYVTGGDVRDGSTKSVVHMHTIEIALRGKATGATTVVADEQASAVDFSELVNTFPLAYGDSMDSTEKLLAKVMAVLASGKLDTPEAASLKTDISSFSQSTAIKESVKTEIANLVTAGELYTKVAHDEALKVATDKVKAEADAAIALEKKKTERLGAVIGLGLNPEAELPALGGKKIGDYIGSFGADANGELGYNLALESLKIVADAEKAKLTPAAPPVVPAAEVVKETQVAAANKGGGGGAVPGTSAKKAPLLLVGAGGGTPDTEEASKPTKPAEKKYGRHALTGAK